jgi:hypothetical protein
MKEQLELQFAVWFMVIGAAAVVSVTYFICKVVYRVKQLEREERRLMIERGMMPPAEQPNSGWPGVKARELELKAQERRLWIEKGLPPPPDPLLAAADTLRKGLVWVAIGLGLAGAYYVFNASGVDASDQTRNWFLFFGVISPAATLYGLAQVVHYTLTRNRRDAGASERDQVR